jgi:3-hydroxyisobutyrate dehydrogenase
VTTAPIRSVAVLGAGGTMGAPMAQRLEDAGLDVARWRRGEDLAAAVGGRDAVLTMLPDADAVTEVAASALPHAADGVVWVQCSTVGLEGIERCDALAGRFGATLVDAPVLGTREPAEQGDLVVLAAGPDDALERCAPVFDAVGRRTVRAGALGAGTRLKLVTNAWLVALVEGAAESVALAEGLGLDARLLLDALEGGPLDLPYLRLKAPMMLRREFPPSFSLRLAAKDARLVEDAATRSALDLPLARTVAERLTAGAREHGDEDLAATFRLSAPPQS